MNEVSEPPAVALRSAERYLRQAGCPALALALSVVASTAFAGRPLAVDDAEPVPPGTFELEAGLRYDGHPDSDHYDFPVALTYGLLPRVELGIGFGGQVEHREELQETQAEVTGIDDLTVGTKVKLLDAEQWWASQALSFNVKLPTANEHRDLGSGCPDYDLTWILSKPLGAKTAVHLNAGYTWVGSKHDPELRDLLHCGVAADYQLTPAVQLVGEVYALDSLAPEARPAVFFNAGCRWRLRPSLVLDGALGHALSGDGAGLIATVGLTWTFGFPRE